MPKVGPNSSTRNGNLELTILVAVHGYHGGYGNRMAVVGVVVCGVQGSERQEVVGVPVCDLVKVIVALSLERLVSTSLEYTILYSRVVTQLGCYAKIELAQTAQCS